MQANVLVLDHDAPGLQGVGDIQRLLGVPGRHLEAAAQFVLLAVGGEADALRGADVDAGIALYAGLESKYRLNVAVEAALGLGAGHEGIEAHFQFELDVLEGLFQRLDRHLLALLLRHLVVVAPFVDAHLLADQVDQG